MAVIHAFAALIGVVVVFLTARGDLVLRIDGDRSILSYLPGLAGAIVIVSAVGGLIG